MRWGVDGIRFDFKRIIPVCIFPPYPKQSRQKEVGGNEEDSPAFVLPDVNAFVIPTDIEGGFGSPQNNMSDCDRDGIDRSQLEQPFGQTAVKLQYVPAPLCPSPGHTGAQPDAEPDNRPGRGP